MFHDMNVMYGKIPLPFTRWRDILISHFCRKGHPDFNGIPHPNGQSTWKLTEVRVSLIKSL